eukprot:Tbor_TRINITY_DN3700_c0_g2::TRINITY_DN3700_c0_g2_i1::g.2386::m.2386
MSVEKISHAMEMFLMRGCGSEAMRENIERKIIERFASHHCLKLRQHMNTWARVSRAIGPMKRFLSCYVIEPYRARKELQRMQLSNIVNKREPRSRTDCYNDEKSEFTALYYSFISIEEEYNRTQLIKLIFLSVYAILQMQYYQKLELTKKQCLLFIYPSTITPHSSKTSLCRTDTSLSRHSAFKPKSDVGNERICISRQLECGNEKEKNTSELIQNVPEFSLIQEKRLTMDSIANDEYNSRYSIWTMFMTSTRVKLIQELSFNEYMRRSQIGRNLIKWYDRQMEDFTLKQKLL